MVILEYSLYSSLYDGKRVISFVFLPLIYIDKLGFHAFFPRILAVS